MFYHAFQDKQLPALGLGCMRLPTKEDKTIDRKAVKEMVAYAMSHGVNYFDTAYGYHNGESEKVIGDILKEYPRESFYLADKFPGYDPFKWRKVEKTFAEQLKKTGVDYFDFYLFHNVSEMNIDAYLNPKYGIFDYLRQQKQEGKIKHLGFSVHGSTETTRRFLEAYGKDMEFCQIQLNYIDFKFQHADEKLALLKEYGIPVWVMEPLRGGRLARPKAELEERLTAAFPNTPYHEIAFRFIESFPTVTLTLSGMSSFAQLQNNIEIFNDPHPLTKDECKTLTEIAAAFTAIGTVPCTACSYCTAHCPKALDIPTLIGHYNEHTFSDGGFIVPSAIAALDKDKRPSACIECGNCETLCPQNIKIREVLKALAEKVEKKS